MDVDFHDEELDGSALNPVGRPPAGGHATLASTPDGERQLGFCDGEWSAWVDGKPSYQLVLQAMGVAGTYDSLPFGEFDEPVYPADVEWPEAVIVAVLGANVVWN